MWGSPATTCWPAGLWALGGLGVPGYRRNRGDHTCVAVRLAHAGPAAGGDGLCRAYETLLSDPRLPIRARPILALFSYFEIVSATILGLAVFGDFRSALTWTGAVVIVASGIYIGFRERKTDAAESGRVLGSDQSA